MPNQLNVLFLAAEADPFVKIGGLGDVAGSLPHALRALGKVDVRLCLPFHGAIQRQAYDLHRVATFNIPHVNGSIRAEALATEIYDLPVYLIAGTPIPADAPVYSSDNLTDGHKFTFFSLAALELMRQLEWKPDLIHANDWHTAPALYELSINRDSFFLNAVRLLGLHNLPYLGVGAEPALKGFGLEPAYGSSLPTWAQDKPLPLGLLSADHIVAASPSYAREILLPEQGSGLHEFLASRADSISGILNGVDTEKWNPETDPDIPVNYIAEQVHKRQGNKQILLDEFELDPDPQNILLVMISRLDPQKGVDLVPEAMRQIAGLPWQLIILGTGATFLEDEVRQLEAEFPERVRTAIRFDSVLSHRMYAGADVLMIPSRYEPCGLTQMIAMRYGCVPVARATGGLRDTIKDLDRSKNGSGFLFKQATSISLAGALNRAVLAFQDKPKWRALQAEGMKQDFSWRRFARQYFRLYQKLIYTKTKNELAEIQKNQRSSLKTRQ